MNENDIIAMLDGLTKAEVSRIKINVDEDAISNDEDAGEAKVTPVKEYHHGRCDVGSPWAKGLAFDVLE